MLPVLLRQCADILRTGASEWYSEFATSNTSRDVAPAAVDKSEEQRLYEYMRALKMRAEIEAEDDLAVRVPTSLGLEPSCGRWTRSMGNGRRQDRLCP
eukprot:m.475812 g.475812  ORF g.475812 m.475812 type:complete len:98 (+) comp39166_c0_seq1:83-376(+)